MEIEVLFEKKINRYTNKSTHQFYFKKKEQFS